MMSMTWGVAVLGLALVGCTNDGGDEPFCGDGLCAGESVASCPADCSSSAPVCGDGVCNGSESLASCSRDCGSSACTESADNCSGETICMAGTCVAAFPRVYRVTNVSVSVPTTKPDGSEWDGFGGAPDMFLSSGGVALTAAVPNEFSASFAGPFEVALVAGQSLRVDVYDEDELADDYATGCERNPITAAVLRSRNFDCAGSGITFTSTIRPK